MFLSTVSRGEHVFRSEPQPGECRLTPDATLEFTGKAVAHVHGDATRLWAFGDAEVHVHGEFDEVYVLGRSKVHLHGKCRMVDVGMHGEVWVESDACRGSLVIVNQHGTVHANDGVRVRAYGEARIHAPETVDVVLHGFARWHTGSEVRGNLSTYRPGYCVIR
jgi:hypothetical protein